MPELVGGEEGYVRPSDLGTPVGENGMFSGWKGLAIERKKREKELMHIIF